MTPILNYNTFQYIIQSILLVLSLVGLVFATWQMRQTIKNGICDHSSRILILAASLNGMLVALLTIYMSIINLLDGHFGFSEFWCSRIIGPLLIILIELALGFQLAISLSSFISLIFKIEVGHLVTGLVVILLIALSIISAFLPYFVIPNINMNRYYVLQSSQMMCTIDFSSPIHINQIMASVTIIGIITALLLFIISHVSIYLFYKSDCASRLAEAKKSVLKKKLYNRLAFSILSISILWLPFLIKVLYEMTSLHSFPPELDGLVLISIGLSVYCQGIVSFVFDPLMRKEYFCIISKCKAFGSKVTNLPKIVLPSCKLRGSSVLSRPSTSLQTLPSPAKLNVTMDKSVLSDATDFSLAPCSIVIDLDINYV